MTNAEKGLICALMIASVVLLILPILITVFGSIVRRICKIDQARRKVSRMLMFSAFLIGSIWCLRYAVGYYGIIAAQDGAMVLTWWEEIFNSIAHALQTFSMDEDYTTYILQGKEMICVMAGSDTFWQSIYGFYASVLNFIAPIAGGAIIFDILASIFPSLRLRFSFLVVCRDKYYFSELNHRSLWLAENINHANRTRWSRPVLIFTDAYVDNEDEIGSEMLLKAKQLGAICVRDDLSHVPKNRFGNRIFILIDEEESGNLQALTDLADSHNYACLKNAEICLFSERDSYTHLENLISDKMRNEYHFTEEEMPIFNPIRRFRNLITNLLEQIPLYEPLIGRKNTSQEETELSVTIFGTGRIGTEMFLASYWYGQLLNCRLRINVVSQENETGFRGRIDYLNPEILRSSDKDDPLLCYNNKGDRSDPYFTFRYYEHNVKSSSFVKMMEPGSELADSDYILVALGNETDNLSVASTLRRLIGHHHIVTASQKRTVLTYVIYDPEVSKNLNRRCHYSSTGQYTDIYMRAIGNLNELYNVKNAFMSDSLENAYKTDAAYMSAQRRQERAQTHKKRLKDEYKYWANIARSKHIGYKVFSVGLYKTSLFDVEDRNDPTYTSDRQTALENYRQMVLGNVELPNEEAKQAHLALLHQLAWLEHRRWNAFTRTMGFRHVSQYAAYTQGIGSYKQMELKLHPCLVECDKQGIRAPIDVKGIVDENAVFGCEHPEELDLLDQLSVDLYRKGYNGYDFKLYDYPSMDFGQEFLLSGQ